MDAKSDYHTSQPQKPTTAVPTALSETTKNDSGEEDASKSNKQIPSTEETSDNVKPKNIPTPPTVHTLPTNPDTDESPTSFLVEAHVHSVLTDPAVNVDLCERLGVPQTSFS